MAAIDPIVQEAKSALVLRAENGVQDLWLWEHTERVLSLARLISALPDFGDDKPDLNAVSAAALFHDAGWAVQYREGQVTRWQLLSRPTNDLQRELGASELASRAAATIADDVRQIALAAIRECNNRYTSLPEAQVLAEAENLEDVGVMYVLRQIRQLQADGRPVLQLLQSWSRQLEYQYWDARINDCLRFEATRELARRRLSDVGAFMGALARDREAADLRQALRGMGVEPPADLV